MPLFLGYKVLAEGREDIYGMVSFNQKKRKCEIASAYPGIDENTVWTVSSEDSLVGRIRDGFAERESEISACSIEEYFSSRMEAGMSEEEKKAMRSSEEAYDHIIQYISRLND